MAWRLDGRPPPGGSSAAGPEPEAWPRHSWLATRPPPRGGLRRRSNKPGRATPASDQRTLALAAFPLADAEPGPEAGQGCAGPAAADPAPRERDAQTARPADGGGGACGGRMPGGTVGVVAASSDASLQLLCLDVAARRWDRSPRRSPPRQPPGSPRPAAQQQRMHVRGHTHQSVCLITRSGMALQPYPHTEHHPSRAAAVAAERAAFRVKKQGTAGATRWREVAVLQQQRRGATLCLAHLAARRPRHPAPDGPPVLAPAAASAHAAAPAAHSRPGALPGAAPAPGGTVGCGAPAEEAARPSVAARPAAAAAPPPARACAAAGSAHLVFGGATDGSVAAWDVAGAAGRLGAAPGGCASPGGSGRPLGARHSAAAAAAASDPGARPGWAGGGGARERMRGPGRPAAGGLPLVAQALALPAAHQSGVNALCVCAHGAARAARASGALVWLTLASPAARLRAGTSASRDVRKGAWVVPRCSHAASVHLHRGLAVLELSSKCDAMEQAASVHAHLAATW